MTDDAAIAIDAGPSQRPRPVRIPASLRRALPPFLVLVALLAFWEGGKLALGIPDSRMPHVAQVIAAFGIRTQGGQGPLLLTQMLINAGATFFTALSGFVLGGLLGFALALIFSRSLMLERGLLPLVIGSQTVPILAVAPMVVVGLGQLSAPAWLAKAVVAAYLTFFPVTVGMLRGLRSTPPDALLLMRSYAAPPWAVLLKLRLPAALPYLFTSLKLAATASVIGAIVAELPAGATNGIGVVILNSAQYYNSRPANLYAAVLVAALVGLAFYSIVALVERIMVGVRPTEEGH